jgi:hypothetical protein
MTLKMTLAPNVPAIPFVLKRTRVGSVTHFANHFCVTATNPQGRTPEWFVGLTLASASIHRVQHGDPAALEIRPPRRLRSSVKVEKTTTKRREACPQTNDKAGIGVRGLVRCVR